MIYIHPTAVIAPGVTIEDDGDDVYIGPLCVIGFPAEWRGHERTNAGVIIRAGTRLTGLVTVDGGVEGFTAINKNCYLMKHCHVGHDAVIREGVTISCGAKIGGHTEIGKYANIGLNAVIHQKMFIAEGVMIGMGSVITKKLVTEPYKTYAGNPAKYIGENGKHPFYTIYLKDHP
jgi:UDP-N-acetylglucosamine acyltransferase